MPQEHSQIIDTIKKVMPGVVSIVVSKKLAQVEKEIQANYPSCFYDSIGELPSDKIDAHGMVQVGGGSGFVVNKNGIILTNKHVICEPFAEYSVIFQDGEKFKAEVLARDPLDDIAILKINQSDKNLPALQLGKSENLELGQTVIAFGNALGIFKSTVSTGIISGLSRVIEAKSDQKSPAQEMRGLIQTDAAINPGNSGGPLTNIFGEVIGINTAVIAGAQNIGFAIPIKAAEHDLSDLEKYGKIKRPLLGIRYLTLNQDIKEKLKLPVDYGAYIIREHPLQPAIVPGGPAEKAGIKEKDIILEWNSQKITSDKNIRDYLEDTAVGEQVIFTIQRGKKILNKKVLLTERK